MSAPEAPLGCERRIAEAIGAVARQSLADWGVSQVALLDDGSPEATLVARVLEAEIGRGYLLRVTVTNSQVESVLHMLSGDQRAEPPSDAVHSAGIGVAEARRLRARLIPDALVANAANKTALLLGGPLPPEPLLPLGDLYASEILTLTGGWSAPAPVRELASAAGGIERLDAALRARIDDRDAGAFEELNPRLRDALDEALSRGRASRVYRQIVPKLGPRTLGVDLFE
ncbi:MAG: hypothetical protein H0X65_06290 [Gemmatimonadetes bacterium]|nr:hypothetical protein [Gemmatimonadota bacterium]